MADPAFAPLTAAMIRRAPAAPPEEHPTSGQVAVAPEATWRDDLRLFAITWAAGFVFFLIFLA